MFQTLPDLEYFKLLVSAPQDVPLFEAAASIARDQYPDLDLQEVQSRMDSFARQLAVRCRDASTELARLREASNFFYRDLRFAGNVNNYYDTDNSFLHKVIETRRGIPITLAVIFCELARGVGLDAQGVSFPGHFLIKVKLHEGSVLIDPFTAQSLSHEDLSERAEPYGADLDSLLQSASPILILTRMLNNLRMIHEQQGNKEQLRRVLDRLIVLQPDNQELQQQRAGLN